MSGTGAPPATARVAARVLVVNAGSSSLKLRVVDPAGSVLDAADLPGGEEGTAALGDTVDRFQSFDAVGHRVVHGGSPVTAAGVPGPRGPRHRPGPAPPPPPPPPPAPWAGDAGPPPLPAGPPGAGVHPA